MRVIITEEKQKTFLSHGYKPSSEEEFTLLIHLDFMDSWETVEYETNTKLLVFKSDEEIISFSVFDVLKASEREWHTWKLLNHRQADYFANLVCNNYGKDVGDDILAVLNWKED